MSPGLIISALAPSSSPLSPQCHLAVSEVREGAESVLCGVLQLCPDPKHISHLQDAFPRLPFLSIPSSPVPTGLHSLPLKRSFISRLLILTRLLFVKPVIGRSQLLVNSFSGKSVPAACCAAASRNPRASQLEVLVSLLPASPSPWDPLPGPYGAGDVSASEEWFNIQLWSWFLASALYDELLPGWRRERVGAGRVLGHVWNKEAAGAEITQELLFRARKWAREQSSWLLISW